MLDGVVNYPKLTVDLNKIYINAKEVINLLNKKNISLAGVVKVVDGDIEIAKTLIKAGAKQIGISRVYQAKELKEKGLEKEIILMRSPMLSEIEDVISYVDYSVNTSIEVLEKLNDEAKKQNKKHSVIIMLEMGDLREGIFKEEEYLSVAKRVEEEFENLYLAGVGMNLGCYGSIQPTKEKYEEFSKKAEKVEAHINRKLEIISGISSNSIPLLNEKDVSFGRINFARMGEGILFNQDNDDLYGFKIPNTFRDAFTLHAQIIEIFEKPSHPIGKIGFDAFRNKQVYEDIGNHVRAIIGVGKLDYGFDLSLIKPKDKNIRVMGASSDHTIIEVKDDSYKVGSIVELELAYGAVGFLSSQRSVKKEYI